MKSSLSKVSGVILLAVFAFFFASTNLCVHTHDGPDGKIVHSHPWSGRPHTHSGTQFQLINILSSGQFDVSRILDHIGITDIQTTVLDSDNADDLFQKSQADVLSLRGPPEFI